MYSNYENSTLVHLEDLLPSCILQEIEENNLEEKTEDPIQEKDEKLINFINRNNYVERLSNQNFKYNSDKNMSKLLKEDEVKVKPFPIFHKHLSSIDEENYDWTNNRVEMSPRSNIFDQNQLMRFPNSESNFKLMNSIFYVFKQS